MCARKHSDFILLDKIVQTHGTSFIGVALGPLLRRDLLEGGGGEFPATRSTPLANPAEDLLPQLELKPGEIFAISRGQANKS